jgi:hypothetical protein
MLEFQAQSLAVPCPCMAAIWGNKSLGGALAFPERASRTGLLVGQLCVSSRAEQRVLAGRQDGARLFWQSTT